jgi:hypothetical protein
MAVVRGSRLDDRVTDVRGVGSGEDVVVAQDTQFAVVQLHQAAKRARRDRRMADADTTAHWSWVAAVVHLRHEVAGFFDVDGEAGYVGGDGGERLGLRSQRLLRDVHLQDHLRGEQATLVAKAYASADDPRPARLVICVLHGKGGGERLGPAKPAFQVLLGRKPLVPECNRIDRLGYLGCCHLVSLRWCARVVLDRGPLARGGR